MPQIAAAVVGLLKLIVLSGELPVADDLPPPGALIL